MVQLFSFETTRFDPAAEEPNPINPIPGQAFLAWLCAEIRSEGVESTSPATEDWGWYSEMSRGGFRYLVGASGEAASAGAMCWTLQIHRRRTLWDRIRGRGRLTKEDPLVLVIAAALRRQSDFLALDESAEA